MKNWDRRNCIQKGSKKSPFLNSHRRIIYEVIHIKTYFLVRSFFDFKENFHDPCMKLTKAKFIFQSIFSGGGGMGVGLRGEPIRLKKANQNGSSYCMTRKKSLAILVRLLRDHI